MSKPIKDDSGKFPAFTSMGGYPIIYLTADDSVMCAACANGENGSEASLEHEDKQWRLAACDIYWEGPAHECEHCNADIESAYGDPEAT